jgi:ribosomal protein S18 acetylase RimI-like enzyme
MIIRKASIDDKHSLVQLLEKFWEYYEENNILSKELLKIEKFKNRGETLEKAAEKYISNKNFYTFVAEVDNKVVGYITGNINERKSRVFDKEGYIEDWFVEENDQGKGVGRKLMEELIKEFKNKGVNYLKLGVYAGNDKIIQMYRLMGFIDSDLALVKRLD